MIKSDKADIPTKELQRYQSKGRGAVVAALIILVSLYYYPFVAHAFWEWTLNYMKTNDVKIERIYGIAGYVQCWGLSLPVQLIYALIYYCEIDFFERYKVLEGPWPWKEDSKNWRNYLLPKSIGIYFLNMLVIAPFTYTAHELLNIPIEYDISLEGIPSRGVFLGQLIFCAMMEDFTFHMSHRALHWKVIYPYIHKVHHEHKTTIAISANYAHPIEFIFGNILPTAVGAIILGPRCHITTVWMWFALRTYESTEGHSGYDFPWSIFRMVPFGSDYGYHVFHHSNNIGNFSSFFTLWDTVFGSNKAYYKFLDEERER